LPLLPVLNIQSVLFSFTFLKLKSNCWRNPSRNVIKRLIEATLKKCGKSKAFFGQTGSITSRTFLGGLLCPHELCVISNMQQTLMEAYKWSKLKGKAIQTGDTAPVFYVSMRESFWWKNVGEKQGFGTDTHMPAGFITQLFTTIHL